MPVSTIIIVWGTWLALLVLTVWSYRRGDDGSGGDE
jgi:hypothetical protein